MRPTAAYSIDEQGEVSPWRADAPPAHAVRYLDESTARAVRDLGHTVWSVTPHGVHVCIRPSLMSAAAAERLLAWLRNPMPARCALWFWADGAWHYELHWSLGLAAFRIETLLDAHARAQRRLLRSRQLRFSTLRTDHPEAAALAGAMDAWRELRHASDADAIARTASALGNRWVLVAPRSDGDFAIEQAGHWPSPYVVRWLATNRGRSISSLPDQDFARNCVRGLRQVAASGEPLLEAVDCLAHWTGFGRVRSRFRRIVLPFDTPRGVALLSGSILDPSIDMLG